MVFYVPPPRSHAREFCEAKFSQIFAHDRPSAIGLGPLDSIENQLLSLLLQLLRELFGYLIHADIGFFQNFFNLAADDEHEGKRGISYINITLSLRDMDCLFCKIIQGQIPGYKVYEDKDNLAFLDIKPHAEGHAVVIPKIHAETVFELSAEQNKKLMAAVVKTMEKIRDTLNPAGFNVGWNHNPAGGQVVPHLHIHIFPRYHGDGGGSMHSIVRNPGQRRVEEVAALFQGK